METQFKNKQPVPLVPENGYDMFYQEVIDNDYFKKVILQIKGSKKYNSKTKTNSFKPVI